MLFLYDGNLNALDLMIAKKIEKTPQIISENNIFEAAQILGISASKLTKYCQKINLKGFKEMKYKLSQELEKSLELQPKLDNINIKEIVNDQFHSRLFTMPALLQSAKKIILITDAICHPLASYICYQLRSSLHVDVVVYQYEQDISFEYFSDDVLTILIDKTGDMQNSTSGWYRLGYKYIHITPNVKMYHDDYIPICLNDSMLSYPFDLKVLIIFEWCISR